MYFIKNKKIELARGSNLNMVNIAKFPFPVTACMSFDGLVQFFSFAQMESYRNFSEGFILVIQVPFENL